MKPLKGWIILEEVKKEISKILVVEDEPENNLGKVLQVGDGVNQVKEGEIVVIQKFGFTEIEHEGKKYLIGKEENILAVC